MQLLGIKEKIAFVVAFGFCKEKKSDIGEVLFSKNSKD